MGLVVEDDDLLRRCPQLPAYPAHHLVGGLLERRPGKDLFGQLGDTAHLRPELEAVEVRHHDPGPTDPLPQFGRHQIPFPVVVIRVRRQQYPQPVADRDPRGHDQEPVGEPIVLRAGRLVESVPRHNHCHHHRLPGARGHLVGDPEQTRVVNSRLVPQQVHNPVVAELAGRLGDVDRRLDGFDLTEEKRPLTLRLGPILQEATGSGSHPLMATLPPQPDPFPDPVDRRVLLQPIRRPLCIERLLTTALACRRNRDEVRAGSRAFGHI